jgi:hypothetical protein
MAESVMYNNGLLAVIGYWGTPDYGAHSTVIIDESII